MKNTIIALLIVALIGFGVYFITKNPSDNVPVDPGTTATSTEPGATTTQAQKESEVIGTSVQGLPITAYHYGSGETDVLLVGGIHGGYEWNTVLLAYQVMDYLKANPTAVPSNVRVTVIPVLNPDGLNKTVGTSSRFEVSAVPKVASVLTAGRFNSNNVDLNRNFDCGWQSTGTWQNKTVSAGTAPFSEPESRAFRDYVNSINPAAVVVWYSAAGGVFSSNCQGGILADTRTLTNTYAKASGYSAHEEYDFYELTGDAVNWLAKENIPGISVLLTNHTDLEWDKNRAGIEAVLKLYGGQ